MSTWLRLRNDIKARISEDLLTETEQFACRSLVTRLLIPGKILNLYGPSGCGKTITAWVVSTLIGAIYVPQPGLLRSTYFPNSRRCILDQVAGDEIEIRRILGEATLQNIDSFLIITQLPSALRMEAVSLSLPTDAEIYQVVDRYTQWGYFVHHPLSELKNFWQVMQACC